MRCCLLACAAMIGGAAPWAPIAAAQPSVQERMAEVRSAQSRKDPRRATLEKLMTPTNVDLKDVRLEDALTFLTQAGDIEADIAWQQDGQDGLDPDARVTLSVKEQPLLTLLEMILDRAPGGAGANAWQLARDGRLEIGPKSRLNKHATMKIYDIRDLTYVQPDFPAVPQLDLDTVLQQASQRGSGGGSGGGIFNQREQNDTDRILRDEQQRAEDLVTLIVQNIEPEQWDRNGGDGATIRLDQGTLLIKAPDYIHRQIAGYPFWRGR